MSLKDVEEKLAEAGEKLLRPPSSIDEVISLLDLSENALTKVEQSPGKSMEDALSSLRKALVSDELLGHPDTDVKVSVAACISEITRITAPDAPYGDETMKKVFQLIVSSFKNLPDKSSRSYHKRAGILETVAKIRSCVIMLDLECDDLITEMFQIFFRTIRDYHPNSIFTCMETIMNLVLEESEEVSTDLLTTLLFSVKRGNEEVLPIARRLAERIFGTSAVKLKPYLIQAIKHSDISLDNYSKIVTSVCEGTVGEDASNAFVEQPSDVCKAAAVSIELTQEGDGSKAPAASSEATQEGDGSKAATASSKEIQLDGGNKAVVASSEESLEGDRSKAAAASSEETQEDVKDVKMDCLGDKFPAAKRSPKRTVTNGSSAVNKEKTSVKVKSSQKANTCENDNKSTDYGAISKPESYASDVEKSSVSESNSKKTSKDRRTMMTSPNNTVESSEASHVDGEKEAKTLPVNLDSHERSADSSLNEDISPKVKNVGSDKDTGAGDIEAFKDANAPPTSPITDKPSENLPKTDEHQQKKECAAQVEVSSPERTTEKASERACDSGEASGESPAKEASERACDSGEASGESPAKEAPQESPLKDETFVEVGTSKHEDSGTSGSEDKLVNKPSNKLNLSDNDDGSSMKKKEFSIKRARTKPRSGKVASKSFTRLEKDPSKASQGSPLKHETSVEVSTSKHEDSGTSDSEGKLVEKPSKMLDLSDNDDGSSMKTKEFSIKRARTKARSGKSTPKSFSRPEKGASKTSREFPLKDETSVEVSTSKHEDSGASESEDKLIKKKSKKMDLSDNEDFGSSLKKKKDSIKRVRTKPRPKKGASKSFTRPKKGASKASQESPSEDETSVEVSTSKYEDSGSSDTEDKLVRKPLKKLDSSDNDDDGSLKKKVDSIKRARTKVRSVKGTSKSSKADNKVMSSQTRTPKSSKVDEYENKILSKRKRSLGSGEASGSLKYGKNLVRSRVKVWWPMDEEFYKGVIVSYDRDKRKHEVVYDDGDVELLNLRKEEWKLIGDDSDAVTEDSEPASTDVSSEMPKSKKVKKSATSVEKQQDLDDVSPKRLSATTSKSKGKSSISGRKTKNANAQTKSKDVTSKSGAVSEDESGSKSKYSQKISGKSSVKAKLSKDNSSRTAGKSKEDTLKIADKGKSQGSGSKSSAGKGKYSSTKGKGSHGHVQETDSESSEMPEIQIPKRKLSDSLKDYESESKSAKKRRTSVKA